MSGLSKMIADFFVRENVIEHEEYEIYKYGSDILIENIGTTIFLICLGFIFNKEISTLIFMHMAHPNGRVCGAKRPKCEAERSHHL